MRKFDRIADSLWLAALKGTQRLFRFGSIDAAIRISGQIGVLFCRLSGRSRIGLANLRLALGGEYPPQKLRTILEESYRNFAMSMAEFLLSPFWSEAFVRERMKVADLEKVKKIARRGKGLILLTAHYGNWEVSSFLMGIHGFPAAVLVRRQKMKRSDAFLNAIRTRWGAEIAVRGMNSRRLIRRLLSGGLAAILADQDAGTKGVLVPFFGKRAAWPRGVARFARMTGAAILPVFVVREGAARHSIHFGEEIAADPARDDEEADREVMAGFAVQLERWIRKHPDHWLWAHRRWKSTPDRDFMVLSDGKPGHFKQALELYKRLGHSEGSGNKRLSVVELEFRSSKRRRVLDGLGLFFGGRFGCADTLLRWALTAECYRELFAVQPDVILSCGSGTEAVHLLTAQLTGARSAFIQKPQYGWKRFDAVLVPQHDEAPPYKNLVRTTGALSENRDRGIRPDAGPRLGLLIGGPSRHADWPVSFFVQVVEEVNAWASQAKREWRGTSSRRTAAEADETARRLSQSSSVCKQWISPLKENPPGAYESILSESRWLVVTGDSISMVSEALASGAKVLVVIPDHADAESKLRKFIASLEGAAQVTEVRGLRAELTSLALAGSDPRTERPSDVNADAVRTAAALLRV